MLDKFDVEAVVQFVEHIDPVEAARRMNCMTSPVAPVVLALKPDTAKHLLEKMTAKQVAEVLVAVQAPLGANLLAQMPHIRAVQALAYLTHISIKRSAELIEEMHPSIGSQILSGLYFPLSLQVCRRLTPTITGQLVSHMLFTKGSSYVAALYTVDIFRASSYAIDSLRNASSAFVASLVNGKFNLAEHGGEAVLPRGLLIKQLPPEKLSEALLVMEGKAMVVMLGQMQPINIARVISVTPSLAQASHLLTVVSPSRVTFICENIEPPEKRWRLIELMATSRATDLLSWMRPPLAAQTIVRLADDKARSCLQKLDSAICTTILELIPCSEAVQLLVRLMEPAWVAQSLTRAIPHFAAEIASMMPTTFLTKVLQVMPPGALSKLLLHVNGDPGRVELLKVLDPEAAAAVLVCMSPPFACGLLLAFPAPYMAQLITAIPLKDVAEMLDMNDQHYRVKAALTKLNPAFIVSLLQAVERPTACGILQQLGDRVEQIEAELPFSLRKELRRVKRQTIFGEYKWPVMIQNLMLTLLEKVQRDLEHTEKAWRKAEEEMHRIMKAGNVGLQDPGPFFGRFLRGAQHRDLQALVERSGGADSNGPSGKANDPEDMSTVDIEWGRLGALFNDPSMLLRTWINRQLARASGLGVPHVERVYDLSEEVFEDGHHLAVLLHVLSNGKAGTVPNAGKGTVHIGWHTEYGKGELLKEVLRVAASLFAFPLEVEASRPADKQTSSNLPADKQTSSNLPADKQTSSNLPVDKQTSSNLPEDEQTSSNLPADEQTSSNLPLCMRLIAFLYQTVPNLERLYKQPPLSPQIERMIDRVKMSRKQDTMNFEVWSSLEQDVWNIYDESLKQQHAAAIMSALHAGSTGIVWDMVAFMS
ncbi:hypothetical protein CYMTET_22291 [Cymbomonas tetramitiformis]|uniref:Uncharacterized protein n=1 Tax=Cymbomonas tetramitiformis TaxID=36881 RepID=A0AAE0G080_9CHLO|nr:hypothetical protein CYMTET_22291 [Cymbomonas tetramitiformis]